MKNPIFINDKTDFKDEVKVLHHVLFDEMISINRKIQNLRSIVLVSIVVLILGLIIHFTSGQSAGLILIIAGIAGTLLWLILNLFVESGVKIKKIGLVHLPISKVPFQNSYILVDRSGLINPVTLHFSSLDKESILKVKSLEDNLNESIRKMPLILSSDESFDFVGNDGGNARESIKIYKEELDFIRLNLDLAELFSVRKDYQMDIRALNYSSDFLTFLQGIESRPGPMLEADLPQKVAEDLNIINGVVKMYDDDKSATIDIDSLCLELKSQISKVLQYYDYSVFSSLMRIMVPVSFRHASLIDESSYNLYCPTCNKEKLEILLANKYNHGESDNRVNFPPTTKMKPTDIIKGRWTCPLCHSETSHPIRRHKMDDEIFTPVYDLLYQENLNERLAIYNNINDQKRAYTEKAESLLHEVFRESRTKVDTIKSKVRTVEAEIVSDTSAIAFLNQVITKYKIIESRKAMEIEAETESFKREIVEESARTRQIVEDAVNNARSEIAEATARYSLLEREDQARRDSIQRSIAESSIRNAETNADLIRFLAGKETVNKY
ncbi:MAG: hypothetical protein IH591_06015 [Bacteroidales bacterium]|nr:hypothetical protein [Bacteroidales bacterium]